MPARDSDSAGGNRVRTFSCTSPPFREMDTGHSPKGKRLSSMSPRGQRAFRQRTLPPSNPNGLTRFPSPAKPGTGSQYARTKKRERLSSEDKGRVSRSEKVK